MKVKIEKTICIITRTFVEGQSNNSITKLIISKIEFVKDKNEVVDKKLIPSLEINSLKSEF